MLCEVKRLSSLSRTPVSALRLRTSRRCSTGSSRLRVQALNSIAAPASDCQYQRPIPNSLVAQYGLFQHREKDRSSVSQYHLPGLRKQRLPRRKLPSKPGNKSPACFADARHRRAASQEPLSSFLISIPSSSSWSCLIVEGVSIITSRAWLFFGKAM